MSRAKITPGTYRVTQPIEPTTQPFQAFYSTQTYSDHKDVHGIEYTDCGYLLLYRGENAVAIFPPGQWKKVELHEEKSQ